MKIYKTPCKNCLFYKNRIVDTKRAAMIARDCAERDIHFICHVPLDGNGYATSGDGRGRDVEVCCAGFYEAFKDPDHPLHGTGAVLRMATGLGVAQFVDQPEGREMLPPARAWEDV